MRVTLSGPGLEQVIGHRDFFPSNEASIRDVLGISIAVGHEWVISKFDTVLHCKGTDTETLPHPSGPAERAKKSHVILNRKIALKHCKSDKGVL